MGAAWAVGSHEVQKPFFVFKKSKALRGEGAHGTWAHRVNLERAEKYGEKLKSIHSFYTGANKAKIVEINSV